MNDWPDHFSDATDYALYRPAYPAELFEYLGAQSRRHRLAWDCASGSGQAAISLLPLFDTVIATDASSQQLKRLADPPVARVACHAEHVALRSHSVDLVVVAQALHWFRQGPFYREVERVARPGALLAFWTYSLLEVDTDVDRVLHTFARQTIGPYWPPERVHVDNAYRDLIIPFESLPAPSFCMQATWTLKHVFGYLGTWSAVSGFRRAVGLDPIESVAADLAKAWGQGQRVVRWPLHLRLARTPC